MRLATALAVSVVILIGTTARADDKDPSYTKDIKPFLTKYCVECHGDGKPKAGVRVNSYDALIKAGRKTLVVPKKPDESFLVMTMVGKAKRMPPRKFTDQPTEKEINLVKAWVEAGAKDDSRKAEAGPALKHRLEDTLDFPHESAAFLRRYYFHCFCE